ncbi:MULTISPECIES: hypothetical protein [Pontibacter]|uniref:Uncharacterized protein n=1 Tax=Pontibacter qinzhouensis TaxID=2603253 RepID=A0A5C8IND6_9BACT|nr:MULTISPECIES: hypothetical protein [Pontibacter]TXK22526.1 hypothetical protein FVR03_22890 [Pontibacter qinzhouensis]
MQTAVINDVSKDSCLYTTSNTSTNNNNNDSAYDNSNPKDKAGEDPGVGTEHKGEKHKEIEGFAESASIPSVGPARAHPVDAYTIHSLWLTGDPEQHFVLHR